MKLFNILRIISINYQPFVLNQFLKSPSDGLYDSAEHIQWNVVAYLLASPIRSQFWVGLFQNLNLKPLTELELRQKSPLSTNSTRYHLHFCKIPLRRKHVAPTCSTLVVMATKNNSCLDTQGRAPLLLSSPLAPVTQ